MSSLVDANEGRARVLGSTLLIVERLSVEIPAARSVAKVVDDVSFEIGAGEAVALVGESGSGKTMTALAIMGLLPAGSKIAGSIRLRDQELVGLALPRLNKLRGRNVAIVFQEPMSSFNPAFTVGEQIAETLRQHLGASRVAARNRTVDLLPMVGIPEPARRSRDYPHMFSGGMLQRVGIAMALACEPDLLIADEPTSGLDATIQASVIELLASLRDSFKTSLLFLTHDFGAVASLCDRVLVMYCGQVVEAAGTEALFTHPRHPYTEGLLGAIANLDGTSQPTAIKGSVPSLRDLPQGCRFHPRCSYAVSACTVGQIEEIRFASQRVRCARTGELNLRGLA